MQFFQTGLDRKGLVGYPAKTRDRVLIEKVGKEWVLTVREEHTDQTLHTFKAKRQYLCCQEACKYFGEGAYNNGLS